MKESDVDRAAIGKLAVAAAELRPESSSTLQRRFDAYLFWSFDLVGSTALKSRKFTRFHWVDVIRDFYKQCEQLLIDLRIADAVVWKYVGDEVVFYRKITEPHQIEQTVSAVYRCLDAYTSQLKDSSFADAWPFISIKGMIWIAPVKSYIGESYDGDPFADIDNDLNSDDQMIAESGRADFLGPNIDAGFRLAVFARKKQLVVSPALAAYLLEANSPANNLRIVSFDHLKGVGGGALYPGIWYSENWSNVRSTFDYEERHADALVRAVCDGRSEPLETLDEVRNRFDGQPYFFPPTLIDRIIGLARASHETKSN